MNTRSLTVTAIITTIVSVFGVVTSQSLAGLGTPAAVSTTTSTTAAATTTTLVSVQIPPDARCPMWWSLARTVGFTDEQLPTLDRIMHVESRCDATALNADDPNGGSISLTQINRFWCLPSRYYPDGYLQHVGVLTSCDELWQPEINLRAALALVEYSESIGLSAWHQWAWL